MSITVDIDNVSPNKNVPSHNNITHWVKHVLSHEAKTDAELSIRIVDKDEIQQLNASYRNKDKPTNVLSFPAELPEAVQIPLLGDIIICAPIVEEEAREQQKSTESHWAHMLIHGTLHLLGYDHIDDTEAEIMEGVEIKLMQSLDFESPYQDDKKD